MSKLQIIIPMSGVGQRFTDAGYTDPKPLIRVDGKPIIEHIVHMLGTDHDYIFICNSTHLATTPMRDELTRIVPHGHIVEIPNHKKGPVYAVCQLGEMIDDAAQVIVNYCDFYSTFDMHNFLDEVAEKNADGAIVSYRGFHPHMLNDPNYAFIKDTDQWMDEIKEKEPFTDNRMDEFASNGTYYFRRGADVKHYFEQTMANDNHVNGEYYVSVVYNEMVADNKRIWVYEVPHMLQWGTPQDLETYQKWSDYFRAIPAPTTATHDGLTLIPMAGRGKRFADEGYTTPKPLIPVNGSPMVVEATRGLPQGSTTRFICLADHAALFPSILSHLPGAEFVTLDGVTDGQAESCAAGIMPADLDKPVMIGACDNGMIVDNAALQILIDDDTIDAIAFSFRDHQGSAQQPQMYGWIQTDAADHIQRVSVKQPISEDPYNDHAIVGSFFFRSGQLFMDALAKLKADDVRVNGEFYVDSMLNTVLELGKKAVVFEVDHYVCWGTPNEYKTYGYWDDFFSQCEWHPYSI